ncbi:MAG: hypothetical protein AB7U73_25085 [Pirellulales bacterium]
MADQFDPYREALVIETDTVWPPELADVPAAERSAIEQRLHAQPADAANLEYVRLHTGFCRTIHVTPDDVARVG